MKRFLACAVLLAAVAACGEKTETADGAATPAAVDTASGPSAPANMPAELKEGPAPGKWKMTMSAMGQAMPSTETCVAQQMSIEEAQKAQLEAGVTCSEQNFKKEGDAWVGHFVCSMDMAGTKTTTITDMKVTGDFNTKYTTEMTSKMDPPVAGMPEQKISITAERLGDC